MSTPRRRKPKVWMNVTTSANWHRPVVGIVRVEREICQELGALYGPDDFGLCIFEGNEFVPFKGTARLPRRSEAGPLLWPDKSRHVPRSSTFDPVLGVARRSHGRTESKPSASIGEAVNPGSSSSRMAFGDVIVSVGLDWDHPYVDSFHTLKTEMGMKIVTCCYDLIPVVRPQYCVDHVARKFADYFTKISWASSTILCISERSRDDYREFARRIGAPEVETLVIPLGDNVRKGSDGTNITDVIISEQVSRVAREPFILFVSTIERRKNHEVLYRAYHLLTQEGHGKRLPRLVFVGMPGWGVGDLLKDIELDPLTRGLIVQLNHVTDTELNHLYEKASFCVYPSLYEGWGLPVGEALAYGKAVLASPEASIPEVGGDLVTYLDAWNPRAWANEILDLINRPERVQAMEKAVRQGYQARTWHDTAQVVSAALDKLRELQGVEVILYPGYDLYTEIGMPCGETIRSTGAAGTLTRGPYRMLPAGTYIVAIALDKLEGSAGNVCCTLRSGEGSKEHGAIKIEFDENEHSNLVATITGVRLDSQISDYEICIEITENLLVAISSVEIRQALS